MYIPKIELNFHPNEKYFPSTNKFQTILNNHPIYYNINYYTYKNIEYISIVYRINYNTNGAIGFGYSLFPYNKFLGFHNYDREHIMILLDKNTHEPEFVYFSAHNNEGRWLPWSKCKKTKNNILKVYIARASHAHYPCSGTWFRVLGLANDHTSEYGKKINPSHYIFENFNINILNFYKNSCLMNRILCLDC